MLQLLVLLRNAYRRKSLSGWYNSAAFEKEAKKAVYT
jgi:hypothetical protein